MSKLEVGLSGKALVNKWHDFQVGLQNVY